MSSISIWSHRGRVAGQRAACKDYTAFSTSSLQTRRAPFGRNGLSASAQPCLCGPKSIRNLITRCYTRAVSIISRAHVLFQNTLRYRYPRSAAPLPHAPSITDGTLSNMSAPLTAIFRATFSGSPADTLTRLHIGLVRSIP